MMHTEDRSKDIEFIAAAEAACFSGPWSVSEVSAVCDSEYAVVEVIETIGYAVGRISADEAELYRIGVLPEKRREGYGAELMKRFIEACRSRGAEKIFLEVRSKNAPAVHLYERVGFLPINTRKNYYGDDDALVYMLEIGSCEC